MGYLILTHGQIRYPSCDSSKFQMFRSNKNLGFLWLSGVVYITFGERDYYRGKDYHWWNRSTKLSRPKSSHNCSRSIHLDFWRTMSNCHHPNTVGHGSKDDSSTTHVEPIPKWPRNGLAVPSPCKPGRAQVMIRPCSVCLAEDARCGHGSPVSTTQKWMMKHWKLPKYCGLFETLFLIYAGVTWDPLVAKDEIDSWGDKPWTFNSKLDI